MSEKEKRIMETIAKVVKGAPAPTKDYLLGWAEGAAAVVCGPLLPAQAETGKGGCLALDTERKTPVSDLEIGRRLAGYPPVALFYMGLVPLEELGRITFTDHCTSRWSGYRDVVAFS